MKQGVILLLGNNESPMNYTDNTYPYRQDSTFLYYFGLSKPNLAAFIDCENGEATLFGDDPTIDEIVWTGPQQSLLSMAEKVGVTSTMPFSELQSVVKKSVTKKRQIHFLSPYRHDHAFLLSELEPASDPSLKLIQGIVNQRLYKTEEELEEIDCAVNITGEMHLAAMQQARVGMKEQEVVAKLLEIASCSRWILFIPTNRYQFMEKHFTIIIMEIRLRKVICCW